MDGQIANASDVAFTVRSYEAGIANHVTLPTLCNYMQEAAGISAARLGWGIQDLQAEGLTWMLSRLRVSVTRYVPWGETVTVRTWPSGTKGRLIAKRCFLGLDEKGAELFRATGENRYCDEAHSCWTAYKRLAKLREGKYRQLAHRVMGLNVMNVFNMAFQSAFIDEANGLP